VINSTNSSASLEGKVHVTWEVPSNATIGTYVVNVTSKSTSKTPADVQSFSVPGFAVNVTTRNLAGDLVPYVTMEVYEGNKSAGILTGGSDGIVHLLLEIGNYNSKAYFHNNPVGTLPINVTGPAALNLVCNLTNLRVFAATKNGEGIPNVVIYAPDNAVYTTNVSGIVVVHSLWPAYKSYNLSAWSYNVEYNSTAIPHSLLLNGLVVPWFNTTIICPNLKLAVNVTDAESRPIGGASVVAQEITAGLSYQNKTGVNGTTAFDIPFGQYEVTAYDANGIQLNQTNVQMFYESGSVWLMRNVTNATINCLLYGLNVSIKVVDYFGQPLSKMNVTLQREGLSRQSMLTQPNGMATFNGITGGSMEAAVYFGGNTLPYETTYFTATKSMVIEMKLNQYVMVANAFVDVRTLTMVIIIVLALLVVLTVEVFRRRRAKPETGS